MNFTQQNIVEGDFFVWRVMSINMRSTLSIYSHTAAYVTSCNRTQIGLDGPITSSMVGTYGRLCIHELHSKLTLQPHVFSNCLQILRAALGKSTSEENLKAMVQSMMDVKGYTFWSVTRDTSLVPGQPVFDRFVTAMRKLPEHELDKI